MSFIDQLLTEHRNIARVLKCLERELDKVEQHENADYQLMEYAMTYITDYPDVLHHPHEDVMFARLQRKDPAAADTVNALLEEHKDLEKMGRRLREMVSAAATEQLVERAALVQAGREYLKKQFSHMRVEESGVLPMARKAFTHADWNDIAYYTKPEQDPVFGDVLDENFKELYDVIVGMSGDLGDTGKVKEI